MPTTIEINQIKGSKAIEVKRDLRYLMTPEALAFFTARTEDDFDYSDEQRELEEC